MFKKSILYVFLIMIMGCLFLNLSYAEKINYVGSSTVGKFIYDAEKVYDKVSFNINTAPESGGGENAVAGGRIALGGVAREVKPEILDKGVEFSLIIILDL